MKQRMMLLGISIVFLIVAAGCWNRRELDDLAIALAMGVDKSGDQYQVSVQIVNPGEVAAKKGGGNNSPVATYTTTGRTLFEALRKMTTQSPRKIYLSHLRVFILGEQLAREEGVGKSLDFLSRDHEVRTDFYIIVAKATTAEQVLKILSIPLEKVPANKIFSSLKTSEKAWAVTSIHTLDEIISELVSKGNNPLLTGLEVIGDVKRGETVANMEMPSPPAVLHVARLAAFKNDKLIGWLNESESKGANYINDKVDSTIVTVSCSNREKVGIEVLESKSKVTSQVKNGRPHILVTLQTEAVVGEVACKELDLTKTQTVDDLETKTEQNIRGKIESAIHIAQKKFKTDLFGFGEVIKRSYPKFWRTVEEDWDQEFVDLPVQVEVDVQIRRVGSVSNSFLKEM